MINKKDMDNGFVEGFDQENTKRIIQILNDFEGQFDFFLNQKIDDVLYCDIDTFIEEYNVFIRGFEDPLSDLRFYVKLKMKLEDIRSKVNKLRNNLLVYGNGGFVENEDRDKSLAIVKYEPQVTTTRELEISHSVDSCYVPKQSTNNSDTFNIDVKLKDEFDKFVVMLNTNIRWFELRMSTARLIERYLDFCDKIPPNHGLYANLLEARIKIIRLHELMISAAVVSKDHLHASYIISILSSHIENCVGKNLDPSIIEHLVACFAIIQNLSSTWRVDFNMEKLKCHMDRINQLRNLKDQLIKFSEDADRYIIGFALQTSTLRFIEKYFHFCEEIQLGHRLYVNLLVIRKKITKLINMVISSANKPSSRAHAAEIVSLLSLHIQNCVNKNLDNTMIDNLMVIFGVIQDLVRTWHVSFSDLTTKTNLELIISRFKYGNDNQSHSSGNDMLLKTELAQFSKPQTDESQLKWYSMEIAKRIERFNTVDEDTLNFVVNYYNLCGQIAKDQVLYSELLIVNERMRKLIDLIVIDAGKDASSRAHAGHIISLLQSHIESCVGKKINLNMIGYLMNFLMIIKDLSKKWDLYCNESKLQRNLQFIENKQRINDCIWKMKWYIGTFDNILNGTVNNCFEQLYDGYITLISNMPKDDQIDELHQLANDKIVQIIDRF